MRNRCLVAFVVVLVTALLGLATYSGVTENAPSANAGQRAAAAKLTWQIVWGGPTQRLDRAKVPGGWILRLSGLSNDGSSGCGITFYPDPSHEWNGSSLP